MDTLQRKRVLVAGALGALLGLSLFGACGACGKGLGASTVPSALPSAAYLKRTEAPAEAGPVAVRDVAMWTSAREGTTEDLASLATHEGGAGLVEAASEPELRPTALRAMGFARGWAQLPFLTTAASGKSEDEARLALASVLELAARPRRSEDVEDVEELGEGCAKLLALAREASQPRERRVGAIRALRMMPCPKQDLPAELDAK